MGKEIVYCEGCGRRLHEDEFTRGKAQIIENRPYCAECRPLTSPPPTPRGTPLPSSSSYASVSGGPPSARKVTSTRIPKQSPAGAPPPSTRRAGTSVQKDSRKGLLIGGGVGVGVLLVIVIAVASSGGRRDPSGPSPSTGTGEGGGGAHEGEPETLRQLERFASTSSDPDAILLRCDQARPSLRGTRWEPRLKKVEDRALEMRAIAERERARPQRLDTFMSQIREIVKDDEKCFRKVEVLQMLDSAKKMAGDRAAEVEKFRVEYLKRCDDAAKRQQGAAPPKSPPAPLPPPAAPAAVQPGSDGVLALAAETAKRHGPSLLLKGEPGKQYLGDWHSTQDRAEWTAELKSSGRFRVELTYALEDDCGGELVFTAGAQRISGRLLPTKDWKIYQTVTLGWLSLAAGRLTVAMKAASIVKGGLMNLRTMRCIPAKGWVELFIAATGRVAANDYPGAKALYVEALPAIPPDPPGDAQQKLVYRLGLYNLACIYSVESKDATRKGSEESAFRYLEWTLKTGLTERLCACHADGWGHLAQDKDFDPVRNDARFSDLVKKYKR